MALTAALAGIVALPLAHADTRACRRQAVSNVETIIGVGVRWNKACQSIGFPAIILDSPPANGFICIRLGAVKPHSILRGNADHCLRVPMQGAQIVYRSRPGFDGADSVAYTLKFPRVEQSYNVGIKVHAPAGAPAAPNAGFGLERQRPGPAPECTALVS